MKEPEGCCRLHLFHRRYRQILNLPHRDDLMAVHPHPFQSLPRFLDQASVEKFRYILGDRTGSKRNPLLGKKLHDTEETWKNPYKPWMFVDTATRSRQSTHGFTARVMYGFVHQTRARKPLCFGCLMKTEKAITMVFFSRQRHHHHHTQPM